MCRIIRKILRFIGIDIEIEQLRRHFRKVDELQWAIAQNIATCLRCRAMIFCENRITVLGRATQ